MDVIDILLNVHLVTAPLHHPLREGQVPHALHVKLKIMFTFPALVLVGVERKAQAHINIGLELLF